MKQQLKYIFFISSFLFLYSSAFAQNDSISENKNTFKEKYGIRLGGDINKLVRSFVDDDYQGFEINADYRFSKGWYLAGELGTEEKTTQEDYFSAKTTGSYFKAGADYNMYKNWLGMENMIYSGFRVGAATFKQNRNSFTVYNTDQYWEPQLTDSTQKEFSGLTALWAELIIGIKANVFNNFYVGINVQLKRLITDDKPDNFENIYIPGFNRTYDSGNIGVGFGYNISYLIPLYKKEK